MPRYNVQLPNGKWRAFSGIVDDLLSEERELEGHQKWRMEYYKYDKIEPLTNIMPYDEAIRIISERKEDERE